MFLSQWRRHHPNRSVLLFLTGAAIIFLFLSDQILIAAHSQAMSSHAPLIQRLMLASLGLILMTISAFVIVAYMYRNMLLEEKNRHLESHCRRTQRYTARLVQLNRELEEFTYVVSHDLKEPLRGIEGISRMLIDEYADRMDETARAYIVTLRESGVRMNRLVNELLRLSRINRCKYPREMTDFNRLLAETVQALNFSAAEKSAKISVQPDLPVLKCDRIRMAEVFHNLISNAVKFANGKEPQITVTYRLSEAEHIFCVRDNGIGVRTEDAKRIFQPFQRVNNDGEGTGMGLTICKRIVENNAGRIWLESTFGSGSCFYVALPVARRAAAGGNVGAVARMEA